jgi:hypothetical protein
MAAEKKWDTKKTNKMLGDREAFEKVYKSVSHHFMSLFIHDY